MPTMVHSYSPYLSRITVWREREKRTNEKKIRFVWLEMKQTATYYTGFHSYEKRVIDIPQKTSRWKLMGLTYP